MSVDIPQDLVYDIKQHWVATPELQREAWDWCASADPSVRSARAAQLLDLYNEIGMCRAQIIHPQLFTTARSHTQAHPAALEIVRRPPAAFSALPMPVTPAALNALQEGYARRLSR